jgi:replicative DNA helicase
VPKHKVEESLARISQLQYNIHHDKGLDVDTFSGLVRDGVKQYNPALIVVDYLQIMRSEGRSRAEEVAAVAERMSKLAAEVRTPILTASQASRACEARGYDTGDFIPGLADLAESSKIEHYADTVIALSREEVYNGKKAGEADVSIIKNRSGQTGQFNFKWLGSATKFVDPNYRAPGELDI